MSIIIKYMEMPKSCYTCRLLYEGVTNNCSPLCLAGGFLIDEEEMIDMTDKRCPLVEVPPHGRLIDADELKNDIHYTDDFYETPFVWWDDILESPTVIHADKKEVEE